jgi:hypothetical protein
MRLPSYEHVGLDQATARLRFSSGARKAERDDRRFGPRLAEAPKTTPDRLLVPIRGSKG